MEMRDGIRALKAAVDAIARDQALGVAWGFATGAAIGAGPELVPRRTQSPASGDEGRYRDEARARHPPIAPGSRCNGTHGSWSLEVGEATVATS